MVSRKKGAASSTSPAELVVDAATSRRLARVRRRDTEPEIAVRKALHKSGFRYRVHNRDLPGSPDVANRSRGWAVFVHGCYWHHHRGCPRATVPKRNREFWLAKFAANRERDQRKTAELESLGYRVFTVWECEASDVAGLRRRLIGPLARWSRRAIP